MLTAFRVEFGGAPNTEVYDAMATHIANGLVLAHREFLISMFSVDQIPTLPAMGLSYRLPEGRAGDLSCQIVPIGKAFLKECSERGSITCQEAAIHFAACEQIFGYDCWVRVCRPNGGAHAIVYYSDGQEYDPSTLLSHGV